MTHTYNQKQRILLSSITHPAIPLGARFVHYNDAEPFDEYVLCQPLCDHFCLIDIGDGGRWEDPVIGRCLAFSSKIPIEIVRKCANCDFDDMTFLLCIPDDLTLDQYLA